MTFLDHAGFVLEHGDVRLATDPWGVGDAFLHGWRRQSSAPFPMDELARATHLWFSHEHADHFSPATLRAIPAEARARMRVLYQATRDRTLLDYCRSLGFAETIELPHLAWLRLGDDFRVRCGHAFGGDSWLLVVAGGTRFLNLNDCICEDDLALHDLAKDREEAHDVAEKEQEVVKDLTARMDAYLKAVNAQMPTPNDGTAPKGGENEPRKEKGGGKKGGGKKGEGIERGHAPATQGPGQPAARR